MAENKTSQPASSRYITLYLAAAAIEAFLCLVWLFSIPSDGKNSILWRYSTSRLGMGALLFAAAIFCSAAALRIRSNHSIVYTTEKFLGSSRILYLLLAFSIIAGLFGSVLLILSPARFGDYQYAFARLKPVIAWPVFVCLQSALVLVGIALHRNKQRFSTIYRDMIESLTCLPDRKVIAAMILVGSLFGAFAAMVLRSIGNQVIGEIPWLPVPGLLLGVFFIACGWLYNRSLVRLIPIFFIPLLLAGITINLWMTPAVVKEAKASLRRMDNGSALELGNQYHYSLSIYHILSVLYPGSEIVSPPGQLEEWNLDENRLRSWVPVTRITNSASEPFLQDAQIEEIIRQNPVKVEINTLLGTRYYYILKDSAPGSARLVLVDHGDQRFILPEKIFTQLMKDQGETP